MAAGELRAEFVLAVHVANSNRHSYILLVPFISGYRLNARRNELAQGMNSRARIRITIQTTGSVGEGVCDIFSEGAAFNQPIIPAGRHHDVAAGLELLEELAKFINSLGEVALA
jgi:hypothetical protein